MKVRKLITIRGKVQGVGFRPFVYKSAINNNLKGWVNNSSNGLIIDIEGEDSKIKDFILNIKNKSPVLSNIQSVEITQLKTCNYKKFVIKSSDKKSKVMTYLPEDTSICAQCLNEINDINNRRYGYEFTNCTNCGPRYTTIKSLPYDREFTTMTNFHMCKKCREEYENPLSRRFHYEGNCCPQCGPKYFLFNNLGMKINCSNSIEEACTLLKQGKIITLKSIGGFNLLCQCDNEEVISRLRKKKNRPLKPFAVMMKNIETVKKYCYITEQEEKLLISNKRPIVLLEKKEKYSLSNKISNNKKLGVMLPYSAMHYLLFDNDIDCLIMTSANVSGNPIIYKNNEAFKELSDVVDYFLINNREIFMPIDDTVISVFHSHEYIIRLGRGYAPLSFPYETKKEILALGGQLKNTIAISNKENIFISPYIGDLTNVDVVDLFHKNIDHFTQIYNLTPEVVVKDMHPDFDYGEKFNNSQIMYIQHHHSHIASCLVENNCEDNVIGLAFDGTGYGTDGKVWGGEFLLCNLKKFVRLAHIEYFKIAGNESAIKEPWKIAISLLYKVFKENYMDYLPRFLKHKNHNVITNMLKNDINCFETSSMGRLFDGVSALLGFSQCITFEGEAAIQLEDLAMLSNGTEKFYNYEIKESEEVILCIDNFIKEIVYDIKFNVDKKIIARKVHNTVIKFTVDIVLLLKEKNKINCVALSGGVFQNNILLNGIANKLSDEGLTVLTHKNVPCNDSGISLGQLVIANNLL